MTHSSAKEVLEVYCEAPMSERLYYQLTVHYIPTLVSCVEWYYPIKIVGKLEHVQLESAKCVGTGISGGVDSYYSLLKSLNEDSANYKVTHGLYCETLQDGEFDCELQKSLWKLSENICKESGIEFVDIKSNICTELYTMVHEMTVTSMFLSYVLHCRSYLVYIIFRHHILIKALHLSIIVVNIISCSICIVCRLKTLNYM